MIEVVGRDGRPVRNAHISAWPTAGERTAFGSTDERGRCDLRDLSLGLHAILATHPRHGLAFAADVYLDSAMRDHHIRLILTSHDLVLGRTISDGGRPLPAVIKPIARDGLALPSEAVNQLAVRADQQGRFSLKLGGIGRWLIEASRDKYSPATFRVELRQDRTAPRVGDIALVEAGRIHGVVRDETGAAVVGARIDIRPLNITASTALTQATTTTDGSFSATNSIRPPYTVSASAGGYLSATLVIDSADETLSITLGRAGSVHGVLVDQSGAPVSSFAALAATTDPDALTPTQGWVPFQDADGRFVIDGLAPGTYQFRFASGRGYTERTTVVGVDAVVDLGVISLNLGRVVRGHVLDRDGHGIERAVVSLRVPSVDSDMDGQRPRATADKFGEFSIDGAPPGQATIEASHPDFAVGQLPVTIDRDQDPPVARVVLTRGGTIKGSARRTDGTPLVGLVAAVRRKGSALGLSLTNSRGSFEIARVPEGEVSVTLAERAGGRETTLFSRPVAVGEGETSLVEFTLEEVRVSGQVWRNGLPLGGIAMRLWGAERRTVLYDWGQMERGDAGPPGLERMAAKTADDGSFELIVERPGKYAVQLETVDGKTSYPTQIVNVPPAVSFFSTDLILPGVAVTGIVLREEDQKPVSGASVIAAHLEGGETLSARTDNEGRFSLDVSPGAYRLLVKADKYGEVTVQVPVSPAGVSDLRVVIPERR